MSRLDQALATRFARGAREAVTREYPNHLTHWLNDADDARAPRALHPAFFGALDWHSAVHNHWLLARLAQLFPDAEFAPRARRILEAHLTRAHIARECEYLEPPGRELFERPYGWAWLLALDTELAAFQTQREALAPLIDLIARRIPAWLERMPYPVRSGEHANTAFSLALMHDWASTGQNTPLLKDMDAAAQRFYGTDRGATFAFEPSGHDFLSPLLAEADLMTRVLAPETFAAWLAALVPEREWASLEPARATDNGDYKLAHLAGLNVSRAWMLGAIRERLPEDDPRKGALRPVIMAHAEAGLAGARRKDYGASHWIPSFAVYYLSRQQSNP
jgi:hypothetical protein